MERMLEDLSFAERLKAQCATREPMFAPAREEASVQALLKEMLSTAA
jgi:hypothetical protein